MSRGSSGSGIVNFKNLLTKTEHYDKDERYMAISDLCEALKRNAAQANSEGVSTNSSSNYNTQLIDSQTERRICSAVLGLLDDSSNDVQTVAVKTLSVLLVSVQEEQVVEIADRLCTLVLDKSKSDLRDVYAIGLKTLVETVPSSMGNVVSHRLIGRLVEGIHGNAAVVAGASGSNSEEKASEEIVLACLNVLTDLLTRFGSSANSITLQHEALLNVTLSQLASPRPVVRKRSGTTIGVLATVISDALLHRLVDRLLEQIDRADGLGKSGKKRARNAHKGGGRTLASSDLRSADTRALIRTICTVSGTVGHRLNQAHIDRIVPIFLRFCDPDDAVAGDDEDLDNDEDMGDADLSGNGGVGDDADEAMKIELRESCFAGFESFVLRCPALIQPHLDQIVLSSLAYIRYDPNYSYGDEDDDSADDDEENEVDEFEEEEDDEYSDEDDMSDDEDDENWKVRRGAIRTLTAVVEASKHDPSKLWIAEYAWRKHSEKKATVASALINRFKEREENCRVDIIECFTRLLSYTVAAASSGVLFLASSSKCDDESLSATGVVVDLRTKASSAIVKECEKQLSAKKGGERSKSSAIALLSTLCLAPGGIGGLEQVTSVFRYMKSILDTDDDAKLRRQVMANSKSLKLEALCLVRIMLSCKKHRPADIKQALLPILLPEICQCVNEDWYKVIAEALRVIMEIPSLLVAGSATKEEMDNVANSLYTAIEPKLSEHDLDQEIKECALSASASLLAILHSSLSMDQTNRFFTLLLERLKNETTRIAAIKTLSIIAKAAQTNSDLDLSPIMNETLSQLSILLRQQSRAVRQGALECIDTMALCLGHESSVSMDDGLFDSVLKDLSDIVVDTDLHLCHVALSASNSILKARPSTGSLVKCHILPAILTLSKSPLLQDAALASLLRLLEQIVLSDAVSFDELRGLLAGLISEGGNKAGKQVISNIAECIATIAVVTPPSERESFIENTISAITGSLGNTKQLNLLVAGDLGRKVNLSAIPGVANSLQMIFLQCLDSDNEDTKHVAALALGRASVASMGTFLPGILSSLESSKGKKQYLLLSSLREFIHCCRETGGIALSSNIPLILPHLEKNCRNEEEGVRTMVAECLGSLACIEPKTILPVLEKLAKDDAEDKRLVHWTVGNAIKFAIGGHISSNDLSPFMPTFLLLLQEDDLAVKNVALLMVYSAVHHSPQLVAGLMKDQIIAQIYDLAQLNLERKVDLGPFKHTVDDALPLRKAALSVFATCLEKCPSSLDISSFMPVMAKALADVEDIQLQAHQVIISMCSRHPIPVVAAADSFVEPLDKTVNKKKGTKTGTELERVYEWIKSGLRVMIAVSMLDGAMNNRKFADFVHRIQNSSKHEPFLKAVEEERN
mmetsp:Transcript_26833/g.56514  ORF Transcript_26833/g.56514 Transcript_26833/m.56514 type:complete len:1376 (+) Transcript_26833:345-4472(+)|eukprot:CAMPEP_0171341964 /NCGR_PEP_ID=MMETSP0878-20121228/12668_1 /TAXON_ID=67004 /ORGANISM="Thalassiosira weissflogii, Strain CCMP1336" /LENGTH=1375 /DNA_ID=CAMNT_0011844455 /DNA_START=256 /DNA_END=4383 /DNA_ORIENTATION=+